MRGNGIVERINFRSFLLGIFLNLGLLFFSNIIQVKKIIIIEQLSHGFKE